MSGRGADRRYTVLPRANTIASLARLINPGPRVSKVLPKTLLKYAVGLGLLAWVIAKNWQPSDTGPGLRDALARPIQVLPFALAGLFTGLSAFLTFVRWYLLVRAQELPFTL